MFVSLDSSMCVVSVTLVHICSKRLVSYATVSRGNGRTIVCCGVGLYAFLCFMPADPCLQTHLFNLHLSQHASLSISEV
jgi:hypothetical protein